MPCAMPSRSKGRFKFRFCNCRYKWQSVGRNTICPVMEIHHNPFNRKAEVLPLYQRREDRERNQSGVGRPSEQQSEYNLLNRLPCFPSYASAYLYHQLDLCRRRSKDSPVPCRSRKLKNNYGHLLQVEVQ